MKIRSIFVICVYLKVASSSAPKIFENLEDQIETRTRIIRQPKNVYRPAVFLYKPSNQLDLRRSRYIQQQKTDMRNILQKNKMITDGPLRVSLNNDWKAIDPTVATQIKHDYKKPQIDSNFWTKIANLTTRKPITSRKLKPSSYYEALENEESNNKIYQNLESQKNKRSDYDLNALSALVGQDPANQLEGLKRLLETPQNNFVLPPIRGPLPHPVTEEISDIPNPNTHPNVHSSGMTLEALQDQLDETAKAQLAKALADAEKDALAHVEAQHQAIAKAREEAEKKALAQIALHNQNIKAEALPLALALKQEIVPTPIKQTQKTLALPLSYRGTPKPITLSVRQKPVPTNLYAPSHGHQNEGKNNLHKITITKTHLVTQNHKSPNAYQQVVLETQEKPKNYSGIKSLEDIVQDFGDHQYAARYAFGYKIRDVQQGNEFGHEEKRDGENAKGFYHVLLPDGRMQKVEYYADEGGYHAKVTYENMAHNSN